MATLSAEEDPPPSPLPSPPLAGGAAAEGSGGRPAGRGEFEGRSLYAGNGRWLKTDAPLVVLDLEGRRLAGDAPPSGAIALLAEVRCLAPLLPLPFSPPLTVCSPLTLFRPPTVALSPSPHAIAPQGLSLPALEPTSMSAADVAACAASVAGARAVAVECRRRAKERARVRAAHEGMRRAVAWCR